MRLDAALLVAVSATACTAVTVPMLAAASAAVPMTTAMSAAALPIFRLATLPAAGAPRLGRCFACVMVFAVLCGVVRSHGVSFRWQGWVK